MGRTGAASAFESALKSLVNFQHNKFCKGNELLVLGEINFSKEMEISKTLDTQNKEDRKKLFQIHRGQNTYLRIEKSEKRGVCDAG